MSSEPESNGVDHAIGTALRDLREDRDLSARQLASDADVSAAMISRIENGQVSPSITMLNALAKALNVPVVSLFRETATEHADFTHVKNGEGLQSTRMIGDHSHDFVNLAMHSRRDLQFEAHRITLHRDNGKPPVYVGHGVLFVHALEGEAIFSYEQRKITLKAGDSLSIDAEMSHGVSEILTSEFVFLSVQAERR